MGNSSSKYMEEVRRQRTTKLLEEFDKVLQKHVEMNVHSINYTPRWWSDRPDNTQWKNGYIDLTEKYRAKGIAFYVSQDGQYIDENQSYYCHREYSSAPRFQIQWNYIQNTDSLPSYSQNSASNENSRASKPI
jgi:hypothetical protein